MLPWKTLSRDLILDHSKYLQVENHTLRLPDGRVFTRWPWLVMPDYTLITAETLDGRVLVFRQTKYALDGASLALPGGYCEAGEDPLGAAQRELHEETGYQADTWISLGSYRVDGNHGAGNAHLFLARRAYLTEKVSSDDLEEQELLLFSRQQAATALARGEFKVLAWTTCLALALNILAEQPSPDA